MIDQDKIEFQKAMAVCGIAFDKEISKALLQIYFEDLKDYPLNKVLDGISYCRKHCKYFPRPAHIIESIKILQPHASHKQLPHLKPAMLNNKKAIEEIAKLKSMVKEGTL